VPVPSARQRIVNSAARLFLSRSFQAVGVDELCRAADVRKGSFYHYFPSKSDLAKAVIDANLQALENRWRTAPAGDGLTHLRWMVDQLAVIQVEFETKFGRVVGCPFGNLAVELATADDPVRVHVASAFTTIEAQLAVAVERAVAEGELRTGTDPHQMAHALLAQFQGLTLLAKVCATPADRIGPALGAFIDQQVHSGSEADDA
jgi:TetR/AcrR family transcriptional repressor of nem operon